MGKRTRRFADDGWAIWIDGDDRSTIYLNEWLNPKGKCIDKKGILHTIEVKETEQYKENSTEENDMQLKKAINYLNNSAK